MRSEKKPTEDQEEEATTTYKQWSQLKRLAELEWRSHMKRMTENGADRSA